MTNSGFDGITKMLGDAQRALEGVQGELGTVRYNPKDPASIEAAIQEAERLVDERLGAYAGNPIIAPMANALKESYRKGLVDQAAAARLTPDADE